MKQISGKTKDIKIIQFTVVGVFYMATESILWSARFIFSIKSYSSTCSLHFFLVNRMLEYRRGITAFPLTTL